MSDSATATLTGEETRLDPIIRDNPFPFYETLRRERPVYYDPGIDVWLVTRYEDAVTVLRDDVTYSLEHGYQDRYANGHVEEFAEIMEREGGGFIRDLAIDPPAHTRLRGLTEKAFTAHRVRDLEPRVRKIVADLIDDVADRGSGDGMKDIAAPFTSHVICDQLGFDYSKVGAQRVADWTTAVLAQIGRMQTREEMVENARTMCDLQNMIIAEIRDREQNPREDMITDLVTAQLDDDENPKLSFSELVATVRAFLIAGNDTTAAAIANVLLLLATQERLTEQLYQSVDDNRTMTRFVEEILRFMPPVHGLFRTAMTDVELGGAKIPAMSQICVMYASANYDTDKFADPELFDIARNNAASHMSFGVGIHRCVGAALARMEIKVATQEIVRRLTNIRLAVPVEELSYLPTLATQTLTDLPLTFAKRG